MKKNLIIATLLASLLVNSEDGARGSSRKSPKAAGKNPVPTPKAKPNNPSFSTTPFSFPGKLPSQYLGHDPLAICKALLKQQGAKGEFETTAAYAQRLAKSETTPILARLTSSDTFAASVKIDKDSFKYNADAGVMDFTTSFDKENATKDGTVPIINLLQQVKYLDFYDASNAYGATRTVAKFRETKVFLRFSNEKSFSYEKGEEDFYPFFNMAAKIPMTAAKARTAKPQLRLLFIYQLKKPYTRKSWERVFPDMNSPRDGGTETYHLNANVSEIRVYDFQTGEVFLALKPSIAP